MRLDQIADTLELGAGTIILTVGLGLSALSASERSFVGVFTGFILFIAGYKLSQISVRESTGSPLRETVSAILQEIEAVQTLMVVVGSGTITYGFVLLFSSIESADIFMAVVAAALMFAGYAMAHYAVNRTVV